MSFVTRSKFVAYGFQDGRIQLLKSYKYNRVKMGNQVSSYRFVNRGCPQGSASGPLLWNIFQNDLPLCIATRPSMYAEDQQIYHSGHDLLEVTSKLSGSADQETKWYKSNWLAGNLKKY